MMHNDDIRFRVMRDRIRILSRGIRLQNEREEDGVIHAQSVMGGIGPAGLTCLIRGNAPGYPTLYAGVQLMPQSFYLSEYALPAVMDRENHCFITRDGLTIECLPVPKYYSQEYEGIPIAMTYTVQSHCNRTLGVGAWRQCAHFSKQEQCRYCTIDQSTRYGFPAACAIDKITDLVKIAVTVDLIGSLSIASGSFNDPRQGVLWHAELVEKLRQTITVPIQCHFEPFSDRRLLGELKDAGVDGLAVSLEIFDEKIRCRVCPGKSRTPREEYHLAWERAVEVFGRGNVMSFCLIGFDEDYDEVLREVEVAAQIGVKVLLLFVRVGSPSLGEDFIPSYLQKPEEELIDLHLRTAQILKTHGVPFQLGLGAGCGGCAGCSAITEACRLVCR